MRKAQIIVLILIIFIISLTFLIFINFYPQPQQDPNKVPDNQVIRIIDGDTFELASGEIIRLLCIDTPEQGEQGYEGSIIFLENLILNKEVELESDIQDRDKYNRLLRYVYLNKSNNILFINKEIYQNNYAKKMEIPPSNSKCSIIYNENQSDEDVL